MDVHSILSQRSNLPEGIVIKPDMSIAERKSESLLLKERYCLIQSGTDKRDIKIRLPILYFRGKKYRRANYFQGYKISRILKISL